MALAITRLDVAAPFLANALLVLLGAFLGPLIIMKLEGAFGDWIAGVQVEKSMKCPKCKKEHLVKIDTTSVIFDAEQSAQASIWAIDASQILGLFLGPLLGIVLLSPPWSSGVALLYIAGIFVCVIAFAYFVAKVRVDSYWTWGYPLFTPVSIAGILVSLAAAVAAALIGP